MLVMMWTRRRTRDKAKALELILCKPQLAEGSSFQAKPSWPRELLKRCPIPLPKPCLGQPRCCESLCVQKVSGKGALQTEQRDRNASLLRKNRIIASLSERLNFIWEEFYWNSSNHPKAANIVKCNISSTRFSFLSHCWCRSAVLGLTMAPAELPCSAKEVASNTFFYISWSCTGLNHCLIGGGERC